MSPAKVTTVISVGSSMYHIGLLWIPVHTHILKDVRSPAVDKPVYLGLHHSQRP